MDIIKGLLVGLGVGLVAAFIHGSIRYEDGRDAERQAAIERANDLIKKMEQDREDLSQLAPDELACELVGARWVRGSCIN